MGAYYLYELHVKVEDGFFNNPVVNIIFLFLYSQCTKTIKQSIEECWDEDPSARLTANCLQERMKQLLRQQDPLALQTDEGIELCDTGFKTCNPLSSSLPLLVSQCKKTRQTKESKYAVSTV